MNKIKLIIIFTLFLALGLLYKQFHDYKNISHELLLEVNKLENKISVLKDEAVILTDRTVEQNIKIEELELKFKQQVAKKETYMNYLQSNESNISRDFTNEIFYINDDINITINDTNESNELENDTEDNNITGYGLEHMKNTIKDIDEDN